MRTFFGVVFALLALLCGGCSVAVIGSMGLQNSGDLMTVFAIGGIPMLLSGLMAWALLRAPSSAKQPTGPRPSLPTAPNSQDDPPR